MGTIAAMFALDHELVGGGRIEIAFYLKLSKEPKPPQAYPAAATTSRGYFESRKSGHLGHARGTTLPSCLPTLAPYGGGGWFM